jgi:F-type H+-transporting ATPase subunit delta
MTVHQTIARPYAKAIFEDALMHAQIKGWFQVLSVLAKIIEDKTFTTMIGNPSFSNDQMFQYLSSIYNKVLPTLDKTLSARVGNFIKLLLRYKRLVILPYLLEAYQKLCYRHEKVLIVYVTSAFNLSSVQKQALAAALKKYFNMSVEIHYKINASLIGGLIIQSDELLIDGSIKNQLNRLKYQLIQT